MYLISNIFTRKFNLTMMKQHMKKSIEIKSIKKEQKAYSIKIYEI